MPIPLPERRLTKAAATNNSFTAPIDNSDISDTTSSPTDSLLASVTSVVVNTSLVNFHPVISEEQRDSAVYLPMVLASFVAIAVFSFVIAVGFLFLFMQQCAYSVRRKFTPYNNYSSPGGDDASTNARRKVGDECKNCKRTAENSKSKIKSKVEGDAKQTKHEKKQNISSDDKPIKDKFASHIYATVEDALPNLNKTTKAALIGTDSEQKSSKSAGENSNIDVGIEIDNVIGSGEKNNNDSDDEKITDSENTLQKTNKDESDKKVKFDSGDVEDEQKPRPIRRQKLRKRAWLQRNRTVGVPFLMYLYSFFTIPFAIEQFYGRYLPVLRIYGEQVEIDVTQQDAVAAQPLLLSNSECCHLLATFWLCVAAGRFLSATVSRCLFPNGIAISCLAICVLSTSVMCAYFTHYTLVRYLFTACLGLCVGPFLSGAFVWADAFLSPAPKSLALALACACLGWALTGLLGGVLVEYFGGSVTVIYLTTACCILHLLLYLPVAHSLGSRRFFRITARKGHETVLLNSSQTYV